MKKNSNIVGLLSCDKCANLGSSVFCAFTKPELSSMSAHKSFSAVKKGQVIFHEGSVPQGFFCIYSGKVKIHKLGDDGKDQIVRLAKNGSVLGYRALLNTESYFATATALEDTYVCFFSKTTYLGLLENFDFSMKIIKMLTGDLRNAEQRITNMAHNNVRARMAAALLFLIDFFGYEEDRQTINTVLTRQDIGNIAGTTTETAIRILSNLKKKRIISFTGKKISILNYDELVGASNSSEQ